MKTWSDWNWVPVWRRGVAPLLSTEQLETLRDALVRDDPRLLQGATTSPPPLYCVRDWPCEAGCLIAYPFAFEPAAGADDKTSGRTVGEVEEHFARLAFEVDQVLGEAAAVRHLLNWFDEAPREEMVRGLLPEVELALEQRRVAEMSVALAVVNR